MSDILHSLLIQRSWKPVFGVCLALFSGASAKPVLPVNVWTSINPPGLTFQDACCIGTPFAQGIALDPKNPSVLYFTTESFNASAEGLYKTTDAGSTWRRIGKLTNPNWFPQGSDSLASNSMRLRIDPVNSQHLYLANGVQGGWAWGFYVSNDGGETFTMPAAYKAQSSFDIYDMAVDPANFNHILLGFHGASGFAGGNAGVLESSNAGNTWIRHEATGAWGTGHSIVFLNNSSTWLLGTQYDGFWRTGDGGASWTQVITANIAHGGNQVYYTKAGLLFTGSADKIMRSTDNGSNWTPAANGAIFTTGVYGDGTKLYTHRAYGGGTEAWYTSLETDGLNWTAVPGLGSFISGPIETVFDPTNQILYSACWGAGVLALQLPATYVQNNHAQVIPFRQSRSRGVYVVVSDCHGSLPKEVTKVDAVYDLTGRCVSRKSLRGFGNADGSNSIAGVRIVVERKTTRK